MHALSMIDMGTQPVETAAPARKTSNKEQQFGEVLKEKQQVQSQQEDKSVDRQPEGASERQGIADSHKAETKQNEIGPKEPANEVVAESGIQSEVEVDSQPQVKVQQTLVDLIKTIVQGESTEGADSSDSIETLLTDLVEQLEATELPGEQVLAGVDLSALVAELQSLTEGSDKEELLAQLVTEVEDQLTGESGLLENSELAATLLAEPQQQNVAPVVVETLTQARKLLQKAFDSVVSQKTVAVETVVVEGEQQAEEVSLMMDDVTEEIDPRFAGLLKPRAEQRPVVQQAQSNKEQLPLHHSKQQAGVSQGDSVVQVLPEESLEQKQNIEVNQSPGGTVKQTLENLVKQGQHNLQSQGQAPVQGVDASRAMQQTPIVQLPSGQQVAESQIFDQVVTQVSGSANGESGRMVLRLQPAELGSLKLEIMVEGDRVRANFQAQSQQVQEVIERNLPQLRSALAEQGLKIDQFQVNVDQRQQGQFENLSQQQQNNSEKQPDWHQQSQEPEEQNIPLAHLMQNGGGGINLHI